MNVEDDIEEEFEVDINEQEPAFLKGQSARSGVEVSPIKIVANPDGSLQRAAMTQSALAKERRELREQQQRTLLEAIPKDLSRPWEDPLPEAGERHLAQVQPRSAGRDGLKCAGKSCSVDAMQLSCSLHRRLWAAAYTVMFLRWGLCYELPAGQKT